MEQSVLCSYPKDITIRKADADDFEDVKALEEFLFQLHKTARPDYFRQENESYFQEEYDELLALPCPIAWVAVRREKIVGLCFGKIYTTEENSFCQARKVAIIQDLAVFPEFQGRGIASALMAQARRQAVQEGAASLELCVWYFNESALRLYEKMGMKMQYYRMEEIL